MTSVAAGEAFKQHLCAYEQVEIAEFKTVYFVNTVKPRQINH